VFTDGGTRSWRFLQITGLLQRTLPELDAALSRRAADPMDPDPLGPHRWWRVGRLHELLGGDGDAPRALEGEQLALWLAAVVLDATDGDTDRAAQDLARSLAGRLGLGDVAADEVAELVADAALLRSFTHRLGIRPRDISQLAAHVGDVDRLRSLDLLTRAGFELDTTEQQAVDEVVSRTSATLVTGEAGADDGGYAAHVAAAADLVPSGAVRERLRSAPKSYALRVSVPDLARQAALCEPPPSDRRPRVDVLAGREMGQWRIVVVARDRIGLLAHEARVLSQAGCDVIDAAVASWDDGVALCSYTVRTWGAPNPDRLRDALSASFGEPLRTEPVDLLDLTFDNDASPWHTMCSVEAEDRFGLLGDIAAAFASVDVGVHAAQVATVDGVAVNLFELTTSREEKLGASEADGVRAALSAGVEAHRKRLGRGWALVATDRS
jgi:UTP:GlnB (protein PII) uridylyltransferase